VLALSKQLISLLIREHDWNATKSIAGFIAIVALYLSGMQLKVHLPATYLHLMYTWQLWLARKAFLPPNAIV
jgi:hypothetical protein